MMLLKPFNPSLNNPSSVECTAYKKYKSRFQEDWIKDSDVETVLLKVVELIEEPDPVKASIGVPFYWVAEKAAEAGLKVMLAGQGADELFGGYQRYVKEYCSKGEKD